MFRAKAVECEVAAQNVKDPEAKKSFFDLARGWRDLADQIQRLEHTLLDGGL